MYVGASDCILYMCTTVLVFIIDRVEAERLASTVEDASKMLDEYNERLAQELLDRKKLSKSLAPFITLQKDKLAESTLKLQVRFCNNLVKIGNRVLLV